jgi:hypothetical protein
MAGLRKLFPFMVGAPEGEPSVVAGEPGLGEPSIQEGLPFLVSSQQDAETVTSTLLGERESKARSDAGRFGAQSLMLPPWRA